MSFQRGHTYKLFRETKTKFINGFTALVLVAASTGSFLPILLQNTASALPLGATELRLSSAAPSPILIDTDTATFSVKEVYGVGGNSWSNVLTLATAATITATVTSGAISTNCSSWSSTATVTIPAGGHVVEGSFCYKGSAIGTQTISLAENGHFPVLGSVHDHLSVGVNVFAPTISACTTVGSVVTNNMTTWNTSETRGAGHFQITNAGLHIWTDDSSSAAKVAGYYPVNFPLSDTGTQNSATALDYTGSLGSAPGLQLSVDLNNDGVIDGILVGEGQSYPSNVNDWWFTGALAAPHASSIFGHPDGTLNEWLTLYPHAQVKAIGYSLGSGVHGDGVINSITLGCVKYTFALAAPSTPTSLSATFQYDATGVADGSTLKVTSKSGGNNLELLWHAPAEYVSGYHILTTYPNGTTNLGYQGPNTNAWLAPNGFGAHGEGKYTFQVIAVNDAGESTPSAPFTIYYDTTSPTASFSTTPPTYVNGNFHVEGVAHDNTRLQNVFFDVRDPSDTTGNAWRAGCASGTTHLTYSNNDKDATISCDINTTGLIEGHPYILRIHAGDYAGYGGGQQQTLIVDRTAPTATIDSTAPVTYYNGSTNINVHAIDTNYLQTDLYHTGDSTPFKTYTGEWFGLFWLSDGDYTMVVRDQGGNAATYQFTIDRTAPTAILTFSTPGPSTKSFTVTYSEDVNASEAENPANYFLNNWPGASSFNDANGLTSHATVSYDSATHVATVTFTDPGWYVSAEQQWGVRDIHDLAGNPLSETTALSSALVNPTVPGAPTATNPSTSKTVSWSWTAATDPGDANASGVKGYYYRLTNGGTTVVTSTFTTSLSSNTTVPSDDTYTLHVYAIDNAGNKGPEVTGDVTVDSTAPTATIDSYFGTDTTPTLTGTIDDPTASLTIAIDGGATAIATNNGNGTWSYDVPNALPVGTHTIAVVAKDLAGNSYQISATVKVVTPVITPLAVSTGRTTPAPTVTVTPNNDGQVLGDSTTTPNTDSGSKTDVKGDSVIKTKNAAKTTNSSNAFLGLGWWWLLIVGLLIALGIYLTYRKADKS